MILVITFTWCLFPECLQINRKRKKERKTLFVFCTYITYIALSARDRHSKNITIKLYTNWLWFEHDARLTQVEMKTFRNVYILNSPDYLNDNAAATCSQTPWCVIILALWSIQPLNNTIYDGQYECFLNLHLPNI